MSFLRIIIPTYNGGKRLPHMVECIRRQTMTDYHLVIVDDMSTDDTWEVVKSLKPDKAVKMKRKGLAGGSRNEGMKYFTEDLYTYCVDDDDQLLSDHVFEWIKENAEQNNYPDVIRLNFIKTRLSTGMPGNHHERYTDHETPESSCLDIMNGMPWTRVIKTEKIVPFPEGLLVDDCYQHIKQFDEVDTVSVINEDCYEWLVREGSITTTRDTPKWLSGWYKEISMLLVETFKHDYAREAARRRIEWIKTRMIRGL